MTQCRPSPRVRCVAIGISACLLAVLSPAAAPRLDAQTSGTPTFVPNELIVGLTPGDAEAKLSEVLAKLAAVEQVRFETVPRVYVLRLPAAIDVASAAALARELDGVEYAEPNYIVNTQVVPNDPRFGDADLWGLNNTGLSGGTVGADIDALEAWNITTGSSNVVVAVIDTGIDYTHPDLAANMFRNAADCNSNGVDDDGNGYIDDCFGIDTANRDSDPRDDHNHGTHVGGTIGAAGNNGVGVVGVNWNVGLMACKFLTAAGSGSTADAVACLDYVARMKDRGVNIVATSNSWGGGGFSQALFDAIEAQRQRGILFIAAAGNAASDNDATPNYPSNYDLPNVIAVAATTRTDARSSFSNVGRRRVHIGAPGSSILSTTRANTYSVFSGTSMATPHVSGVAALLEAQDPTRDWRAIRNLILAGGESISSMAPHTVTGRRLNALGSLSCVDSVVFSRLKPVQNTVSGTIGTPITVSALNINCASGATATVSVEVSGSSPLTLRDDGAAPDQAAGDGIYSANFVPTFLPAGNAFVLTFPNGETATVQMQSNVPYSVTPTSFSYRSISGTNLNLSDDTTGQIASPFPLLFAGSTFNTIFVSSNATLNFGGPFNSFSNVGLPTASVNGPFIAPFWDDLYPVPGTNQNVFWSAAGAAPNRELVIEWRDVRGFGCNASETASFQVVFFERRNTILFNYADTAFGGGCGSMDGGGSATIGVQVSPALATQYSFNTRAVSDNTALLWTHFTSPPWTDDPLIQRGTVVKAVHINELRSRIDALRVRFNLPPTNWTDSPVVAGSTVVRALHVTEMRAAVTDVYRAAGLTPRSFGDVVQAGLFIRLEHVSQLRSAVDELERIP